MGNFFAELKRRHVYQVAAAYIVVAWVLLQLFNNLEPILKLPEWAGTLVLVFLLGGFPVALVFAWTLELKAAPASADGPSLRVKSAGIAEKRQAGVALAHPASIAQTDVMSIAVLPFANMSGDANQEFFSDGMTEEITSALAKVPRLTVLGRTSAFQFKGQNRDLREIGQALGASHLIEGSVRKAGSRVRITAQLIRANTGAHLWTDNYDRELTDIFAIQEDIAKAIATSLQVPLGLKQGQALVPSRTGDLESYQQYLRARSLYRARAIDETIAVLEKVIARDANYAPAWGMLAEVYSSMPHYVAGVAAGPLPEARRIMQAMLDKAEMAAREAIRLDARYGGGYVALGFNQGYRRNWAAADDLFRQALALDPNDPDALHFSSAVLASTGRLKQALSAREQLRVLEPFVPVYSIFTAALMQLNGQDDASIALLEEMPAGGVVGFYRNAYLAKAYAAAGRYGEAADTLLAITQQQTTVSRQSIEDAARLIRSAPAKTSAPDALPVLESELNFVYAHIGAPSRAFEAPERNLQTNSNMFIASLWYPLCAPLRKTERFKTFLRNAGLIEYYRARGWPDLCRPIGADDFVCD